MIAEDHGELLRALIRWLGRNFEIVAAVEDGRRLVDRALSLKPREIGKIQSSKNWRGSLG
jgi:hypothetical protein